MVTIYTLYIEKKKKAPHNYTITADKSMRFVTTSCRFFSHLCRPLRGGASCHLGNGDGLQQYCQKI